MRESKNHSRSGRGAWTAVATVAVSALALTGRAASHRAAGVSDQSSSLGAGRSRRGGWRERRDAWRPEEDRLAAAMRADPVYHRYLPTIYPGFDVNSDDWWHKPRGEVPSLGAASTDDERRDFDLPGLPPRRAGVPSTNDDRRPDGRRHGTNENKKNQFKVCLDNGAGSWDVAFAKGIHNLFHPGVCFDTVEQNDCHATADVVIFNEHDFIWGGAHRNVARGGRIELPEKAHPSQVYVYFAHEAAGGFGAELRDKAFTSQFDYLSYVDKRRSAMWWPFGPSLRSLTDDFEWFRKRREARVPAIAWLASDCAAQPRVSILRSIAEAFPVFSMGECLRNAPPPAGGLPQRGAVDPASHASFQRAMSDYMFYFAVENAGACAGYATEKVWMALSRGSVPLYFGTDDVYELLPDRDAIVDLRQFDSVESLARKLHAIATDEREWAKAHAWRHRDPSTWPREFRTLLRTTSTDVKYGVCDVLMKGPRGYHKSRERPRQARCDDGVKVLGRTLGGIGGWGEDAASRGGESGGALRAPTEHLHRRCGAATGACWSLSRPGEGGKGGKGGRG